MTHSRSSVAEICNQALGKLGAEPLQSLAEDTPEARLCRTLYPGVRDRLLLAVRWSFARRQQELVASAHERLTRDVVRVDLPAGFLCVLDVVDTSSQRHHAWRVVGQQLEITGIPARQTRFILQYTQRVKEHSMPTWFLALLSNALAADLALSITGSLSIATHWQDVSRQALNEAQRIEHRQNSHTPRVRRTVDLTVGRLE